MVMIERNRAEIDEFLSGFVHKMENPLASIIGHSQLLLPKMADPIAKEELEKIIKKAERISRMVKNLSTYERKPKKEMVDESDRSTNY
jgi:signal transduction histidine kinase